MEEVVVVKEEEKKRPLNLDWDRLLPSNDDDDDDDEPPPVLIVATTVDDEPPQHQVHSPMNCESESLQQNLTIDMTDSVLDESIRRKRLSIDSLSAKLADKGAKLRNTLKLLEDEQERRRLRRLQLDANGCQLLMPSKKSTAIGASNGFRQDAPSSEPHRQSSFGSIFSGMLDKNRTGCKAVNAFDKEFSYFGRCVRQKTRQNGEFSWKNKRRNQSSSGKFTFKFPGSLSLDSDNDISINGDQNGGSSPVSSLGYGGKNLSSCFARKRIASEVLSSNDSRPHETVVLVDEEEPQPIEMTEQADKLPEGMKEAKMYYPSRDDAAAVEICYTDITCLAPEAYLSSTIMNFYIRYLQQLASPTDRAGDDYHFFNTYFYKKLKEAVSKRSATFFKKFRRWWKGVNIFQKAYILIPIHENLHWSLVIICIPDKEDESGPIILHLDSLGLHCSKLIFSNIRSFLSDEWNYLNEDVAPPDVPIADRVWKHLPRTIIEKILTVPQQRNEYDCGLFVLFFMERFIEEAPERLKKNDLAMFGKRWFEPEDASGLRRKIEQLLIQEFKSAIDELSCISESSPSSPGGASA